MLFEVGTNKPLDEIQQRLEAAAQKHKFGVIAVHDLQQLMKNKGVDLAIDCRVYEVCNPLQAKKVLEADGSISTALPCRISVYGTSGYYKLATMLPTEMMKAFGRTDIDSVATEVEEVIVAVMKEAAGETQP